MYTLCANFEELGLGEGYTVEAYSDNLEKLKQYAFDDAVRQGCKPERLRWFEEGTSLTVLKELWSPSQDPEDPENYDTWIVIEFDKHYTPTSVVNVDAL